MMKHLLLALTILLSSASFNVSASTESDQQAEVLLEKLDLESLLNASIEQTLERQMQQVPAMRPYKRVMLQFFAKYMSYQALKPAMVGLYSPAFTAQELSEISAFYDTPTGKKTIRLLPELMAKGGEIGLQQVQAHMPELQQMIKDEAATLGKPVTK